MIKALLLDADGVVIKKHDYFSNRYKKNFGRSLNDDGITNFFRNDYKKTAAGKADLKELLRGRLDSRSWNGTVDDLLKYWFEGERELDDEILTVVKSLKSKGVNCYLVSDNEKYRADYLLNKVGIKRYFDDTFFSCFVGYTKSEPDFFKAVIKKLKLKPEEIDYWDDDPKNVEVAKSVGINGKVYKDFTEFKEGVQKGIKMKRLFLTSSLKRVAKDIVKYIENYKGMKLAFITTAGEFETGNKQWQKEDIDALVQVGFKVFDYTITGKTDERIKSDLNDVDVICFSGGNPFYLLEKIQKSNCAEVIRDLVLKGKIYIGISAGSEIAGPDIYSIYSKGDVRKAPNLKGYKGLGLVDFIIFPHWGKKDFEHVYFGFRLKHAYTTNDKIILLTNYQYVRVEDDMYKIEEVEK